MLFRALIAIALFYLAIVGLMAWRQTQMIYLPTEVRPDDSKLLAAGFLPWPAGGARYRGLLMEPAGDDPVIATAVVFHGNAGAAWQRGYYGAALNGRGVRVILAEYPGYGGRPGEPSREVLIPDAAQILTEARRQFDGPLIAIGESVGGAIAAEAIAGDRGVADGLMLITPFDRMVDVAAHHYPWLPVRWVLSERYDNIAALEGDDLPVAVMVAARDTIVPPRFGRALHEALGDRSKLIVWDGAGHNDWPAGPEHEWWDQALRHLGMKVADDALMTPLDGSE